MSRPRPPFQRDYDQPPRNGPGPGPGPRGPPRGPPPGQYRPPTSDGGYGRDEGYGGGGGAYGGARDDGPGYYNDGGYDNGPRGGNRRGGGDRRERPYPPRGGDRDYRDRRDYDRGPSSDRDRDYRNGPPRDRRDDDRNGGRPYVPAQSRPNPTREQRLERLAKERVSRTLFVRNIAYETDSDAFRALFETYGEIKEWFDVIQRRGMVFVTYYDVRGAEAGRAAMNGYKQLGRAIDVHFGLPKEHDQDGPCDRTKNQGSLRVTLHPRRMLDERELGRAAEPFGAVKSIRANGFQEQRILEYFDSRAAIDFHRSMNDQPFMDGRLDVEFIWDVGEVVNPDPISAEEQATQEYHAKRGDRGPRGYNGSSGRGGRPDEPPARYDGPSRYSEAPPVQTGRLEEARKVQDLLASLGNVSAVAPPPSQQYPPGPPPPSVYPPPPSVYTPSSASSYPPGPPYPPPPPSSATYSAPPSAYAPPAAYPPPPPPPSAYPPPSDYPRPPSDYARPPSQSPYPPAVSPPPPQQGYQSQRGYSPPSQGYMPPRPQDPRQRPPQQGYQPPGQQRDGYSPQQSQGRDNRDVGSLLAMLNR